MGRQLAVQLRQNRAQAEAAAQQLDALSAQEGVAQATIAPQNANLRTARINLAYTHILAPDDGVLVQRQAKPGQHVISRRNLGPDAPGAIYLRPP
jgi:membrane fusion protein (multidrug efflux system)